MSTNQIRARQRLTALIEQMRGIIGHANFEGELSREFWRVMKPDAVENLRRLSSGVDRIRPMNDVDFEQYSHIVAFSELVLAALSEHDLSRIESLTETSELLFEHLDTAGLFLPEVPECPLSPVVAQELGWLTEVLLPRSSAPSSSPGQEWLTAATPKVDRTPTHVGVYS